LGFLDQKEMDEYSQIHSKPPMGVAS